MSHARQKSLLTPERDAAASLWRLRFEPRFLPTRWLTVYAAYEQRVRVASSASALASPGLPPSEAEAAFRLVPGEGALVERDTLSYWHELDRLALAFQLPQVELTVGRQALGWGRGMFFGAVDVFAPFTPLEVDREWRRGVDAVRADVRLGSKASVEVVGVGGDTWKRSALAGRLRGYLGPVDGELVGGWRARDLFAGFTVSASVLEAEIHGELAAFYLPEPWRQGGTFDDPRLLLKAVAGASYQLALGNGLAVVLEYHYSGFGAGLPLSAIDLYADTAFRERLARGDFQNLGRHLLAASANYTFGMTLAGGLLAFVDPLDGSGVVAPSFSWDLADNVSLLASAYVGWGKGPRGLELRSQLGMTPTTVLIQLRVYDQRSIERAPASPAAGAPSDGGGSPSASSSPWWGGASG